MTMNTKENIQSVQIPNHIESVYLKDYNDAVALEGLVENLSNFFDYTGYVISDVVNNLGITFSNLNETEAKVKKIQKSSKVILHKLSKTDYLDHMDELIPVPAGLDVSLLEFILILTDLINIHAPRSRELLVELSNVIGSYSPGNKAAAINAKPVFKNALIELAADKRKVADLFNESDMQLAPLSDLISNFEEVKVIQKAFKGFDDAFDSKLMETVIDLSNTIAGETDIVLSNSSKTEKDELLLISGYVEATAKQIEFYSNLVYIATTAVGVTDIMFTYFKNVK